MDTSTHHLVTPIEAEALLGKKYFYRQKIYRLGETKRIVAFNLRGQACFLGSHILKAAFKDLELKIAIKFPEIDVSSLQIFFDPQGKKIIVDGLFGKGVSVKTDEETEDDLLKKIEGVMEFISADSEDVLQESLSEEERSPGGDKKEASLVRSLPEEIIWVKVDVGNIKGVEIKSFILISLPSVANFIGVRNDHFIQWISKTTFADFILSAHPKQLQGTQIGVPWKRGIVSGFVSLVPFEFLPEIIIAFRQSNRTVQYPEKANLLYNLAQSTLEAVGLAMSGNKDKAAEELARVGKGLGLSVADQIIGVFKQYESRDFQIETNKQYNSKVKAIGADYAITTGVLTVGITDRTVSRWKAFGSSRNLAKTITSSSREVMRKLSPADGVGMAFGEKHYIKDPNVNEAIHTGRQGKDFFQRLKNVGLLEG